MTDFAWMIERNRSGNSVWWDGRDMTSDPNKGVRFARKEDAERVIETHGMPHVQATEHGWADAEERNERAAWLDEKKANEQ